MLGVSRGTQAWAEGSRCVQFPPWKPDDASRQCDSCARPFEFFRRRHHCRACGGLFCRSCSNCFLPLETLQRLLTDVGRREKTLRDAPLHMTWPARGLNTPAPKGVTLSSGFSDVFGRKAAAMQRVCAHCYEGLQVPSLLHHKKDTRRWGSCIDMRKNSSDFSTSLTGLGEDEMLPFCTRERKICVILLRGSSSVKSCERTDPATLFAALEKLTSGSAALTAPGNMHRKDSNLSSGPSLSSASDYFGSEKTAIDTSTCPNGTRRTCQSESGRFCLNTMSTQKRKKLFLRVPVPSPTSDAFGNGPAAASVTVGVQLVGVTHRHGSDRALLQQYTIGTDAYIILLEGEPVPSLGANVVTGVDGNKNVFFFTCAAPTACSTPASSSAAQLTMPCDGPQDLSWAAAIASAGSLIEPVRDVLGAIRRYSGNTPMCGVVDCSSVAATGAADATVAATATAGVATVGNFKSGCPLAGGAAKFFFHGREPRRGVSVESQASALNRALRVVVGKVIRRDMLRREN